MVHSILFLAIFLRLSRSCVLNELPVLYYLKKALLLLCVGRTCCTIKAPLLDILQPTLQNRFHTYTVHFCYYALGNDYLYPHCSVLAIRHSFHPPWTKNFYNNVNAPLLMITQRYLTNFTACPFLLAPKFFQMVALFMHFRKFWHLSILIHEGCL